MVQSLSPVLLVVKWVLLRVNIVNSSLYIYVVVYVCYCGLDFVESTGKCCDIRSGG